jgi:hypothetical protein
MARGYDKFAEAVSGLERSLLGPPESVSLDALSAASEELREFRKRFLDTPDAVRPFVDRLKAISVTVNAGLAAHLQQLVTEVFAVEVELRPMLARKERLRCALNEICRAQDQQKIRFDAPDFDGYVTAVERKVPSLPKADSPEREQLDALVRSRAEYWIDASILRADRLNEVCDRVAETDPEFGAAIRPMLRMSREYTITLRSPQLKDLPQGPEGER